jgi:hypothetical protein
MKILGPIIALVFLCSVGNAQTSSTSPPSMTTPYAMTGHPEHASQHALDTEQNLLPSGGVTSAQGERPLSDFSTEPVPTVSLGQVAREYRSGRPVPRAKITVIP